jgi:hypothetical protein
MSTKNEKRNQNLKPKAPRYYPPTDCPPLLREQECGKQDDQDAKQRHEMPHLNLSTQYSVISCQLSVVSYQLSVISKLSAISFQLL